MCSRPDVEEPQRLQQSKEPVFNDARTERTRTGRRGTILTGTRSENGDIEQTSVVGKKTLLGA